MSQLEGLVISHVGQGIAVEYNDSVFLCQPLRKLETIAVGDRVLWTPVATDQGRIDQILPRRSLLSRPSRNGKLRPVAANIDQIFVVFAVEPSCDFLLIDQYLAVCENIHIEPVLLLNKADLPQSAVVEKELTAYQNLGYRFHRVSVSSGMGLALLAQALQDKISMLAGQSGVGKSSLTNAFIPDKSLKIGAISQTTKHGRHTTTAATLYHLPDGGDLIDSPGVAIFGLSDLTERQLAYGYREFQPLLDQCRFGDCRHWLDKDCAVRAAADTGEISVSRYQRFLKLREKLPTASV